MKILVTGGCGFIGSRLAGRLVKEGHDVVVLDNLSTGKRENLPKGAAFVKGDIRDEDIVKKAVKGCETVFHLAAVADARADENAVYGTNFLGAGNIFAAAGRINAKVIFTSSAAVYGNGKLPCREDDECKPVSQYGKSKLKAENILKKRKDHFIARLFNVFGPGGSSVVNRFCGRIPEYRDITVYGNGLQTRDYVYIDDAIDALLLGIENSGRYNIGTGKETSLLHLIDSIHAASGCKPDVKFSAEKKGDIKRSRADISLIKTLGWGPKTSLQDGIGLTLESLGFKAGIS